MYVLSSSSEATFGVWTLLLWTLRDPKTQMMNAGVHMVHMVHSSPGLTPSVASPRLKSPPGCEEVESEV